MTPTPPDPSARPKAWVWSFGRLAVTTFYRVERLGREMPGGAVLLVANHPNTLLDPAVIQATAGRPVRFLAKSTLFRRHPMSLLVRHSGAIPVYRRMDPGVDTSRNTEMFAAVEAALAAEEAICLFPEGLSHHRGHLEPIRTGAARMLLRSGASGHRVTVVPVGLNFDQVTTFRSRVTTVFGRPFDAADLQPIYATDPTRATRLLTDRIEQRMRRLLVEADPRHDLPMVTRVDRLYASARGIPADPAARIGRRRLIAEGMERLRRDAPERLTDILTRIADYDRHLERFGLRDHDVDRRIGAGPATRFVAREGAIAVVLAPLALLSLVIFAAPYWITGQVSRWAPDRQSRATWQVMLGLAIYALWIGAATAGVALAYGRTTAAIAASGLIALAFAGMRAVERERAVWRTVRAFLALRQAPLRARATLRRQRDALAEVLEQVRAWVEQRDAASPPEPGARPGPDKPDSDVP